ncbi:MAG: hypothetical protein Q9168_001647 [Polycauliona sp. 1 TL-2023]
MYQPAHTPYPHQPTQQYPQQTPPQQFPQQVIHQQYPPQSVQQQYPQQTPQQQYPPHQQYDPRQHYPTQHQHDYQQHYPPQQQFPQMQYSSQQGTQYPNQYPPVTNDTYADQSQPQPAQQGCYNCGSSGHWAQACSEPKREPPAGAYSRPPPFKRQKPNPPVVTKYTIPHHVQTQHGPAPQALGGSYMQQSSTQYQGPHGPPTPQSGQSPHQQWSQQTYEQQYQQCPPQQQQHHSQPQQQPSHQHQHVAHFLNAPPTPATPYASHLSNQASPPAVQYNGASYFANTHLQSPVGPQAQQMSSASPVSVAAQTIANHQQQSQQQQQQQQYQPLNTGETASVRQASRNSSVSMLSMSVATPSPEPAEVTNEDDDDDLSTMDVPDIPVATQGTLANLVDRPLPANFIVADALDPFDPPAPESNGRCQSKYTVIDKLSTFTSCIRETKYWDDIRGDPIFISRPKSSKLIPMERILSLYRKQSGDQGNEPTELEDGECSRDTTTTSRHEGGRDLMGSLEDSLASPSVAESNEGQGVHTREHKSLEHPTISWKPERSLQVRNGTQGPAGEHFWKRKIIRPVPPPPMREDSPRGSPERTPPMRSRTPSMYELNEIYQQEQAGENGSGSNSGDLAQTSTVNGHERNGVTYDASDPFEPPPPPAHLRKPSSFDGAADGFQAIGSPNGQVHGNGVFVVPGGKGNGRSYSNGQSGSPSRRRSDEVSGRKRVPEDALSDEDNTPKRRQADDLRSKLKKRQPQVAAAYR